jgi:hypothetical protein
MSNNLERLLKSEAEEINHFFRKASIEGEGTPQEVSDRRESALTSILKKYFPFPYRIAKGNIQDSFGARSASIDCLLLNPSHPFTTTDEIRYSIILADGVDVAIELKPHLNTKSELERALSQISSVKRLRRVKTSSWKLLHDEPTSDIFEETMITIPAVIFTIKTFKKEKELIENIVSYYEIEKSHRIHQFDFIVVNNRFILFNSKKDSYIHFEDSNDGIYIYDYKELTLSAFLLRLNLLPQSEMRMSSTVLEHYIKVKAKETRTYPSLNKRLLNI